MSEGGAYPWTSERTHPRVLTLNTTRSGEDWEAWAFLRADAHHDNQHSNHALERKHLEEAKRRNAAVIDLGDLFCAMQSKHDRRASRRQMRSEHGDGRDDYFNAIIDTAADFYAPYAEILEMLAEGNHCAAVEEHNGIDLRSLLAGQLKAKTGCRAPHVMPYHGWVRFHFERDKCRQTVTMFYTHGFGGGGPVTHDVIQAQRTAAAIEGADITASGHTHDDWNLKRKKERLDRHGIPRTVTVRHIKVGTYKDEFSEGRGYHAKQGRWPKADDGGVFLRFYSTRAGGRDRVVFEVREPEQ